MAESNVSLENIELLNKLNKLHIDQINALKEDDTNIEEESALLNFFMERFLSLEKDDKEEIPLDEEMQEKITYFQQVCWPRIVERNKGSIPDHRNPFPEYADSTKIKKSDIADIKGRLAYIANGQERALGRHAREYQKITYEDYLFTNIATQATKDQTKAFVKNQRTMG